ncbi:pyridoxamine 5'-phosphate oxidase [Sneathiella sp.]|uniref:pyridoxamine 5'-phosphate oxidase n=1 Tax=Sneathiella sp. TaxID=1964365 RepID=UPI0035647480
MTVKKFPELLDEFRRWMAEAEQSEANDPTAMSLATADKDGQPSVRMVLLKNADERGFVFYTNYESQKGTELQENPKAALCFHWKSLRRSIRIQGTVEKVSDAEADAYFDSRPRDSRIGAWASQQSRTMAGRFSLETAVAKYAAKFGVSSIPRPDYWSGFRVIPARMEFWRDRPFRLHERRLYRQTPEGWTESILYP